MSDIPNLQFVDARKSDSGKTTIWTIKNLNGSPLGTISWKGQWRKYCFFPAPDTVFDLNCLKEIIDFLKEQTDGHRKAVIKKHGYLKDEEPGPCRKPCATRQEYEIGRCTLSAGHVGGCHDANAF